MRKAEGPNWCSLCQAEGQRTLHIVNRGMDDRIDGRMEGGDDVCVDGHWMNRRKSRWIDDEMVGERAI